MPGPVLDQEAPTGSPVAPASPAPSTSPDPGATAQPPAAPGSEPTPAPRTRKSKLIKGIDVSHHNGAIDFANVLKAKQRFVFIKATQDTSFVDEDFTSNVARARAAGMLVGAYHFFDYSLDGTAQADHFVDRLEAAGGILDALPPVVDVECWQPSGPSTHVVTEARLRDFVIRVYERTGRLPIVYTSSFMWSEVTGGSDAFADLPLWAACWGCESPPTLAAPWEEWLFWQTGIGRIKDVGRLDANVFNGSEEDLLDLVLRPVAIDGGATATRSSNVTLDLGGRHATEYRTSPDGETWDPWRPLRATARAQLATHEGDQTLHVQLRAGEGVRSPVYSDAIVLDRTDPQLSALTAGLADGPIAAEPPPSAPTSSEPSFAAPTGPQVRVPVRVAWTAGDALSGLAGASVDVACGEGETTRVEVAGSSAPGAESAWQAVVGLDPAAACDITVVVRDAAGNSTRERLSGVEAAGLPPAG
jgi:GH25 family lysozyme M1 (1,4-beta-N-acetylmuramidase)